MNEALQVEKKINKISYHTLENFSGDCTLICSLHFFPQ